MDNDTQVTPSFGNNNQDTQNTNMTSQDTQNTNMPHQETQHTTTQGQGEQNGALHNQGAQPQQSTQNITLPNQNINNTAAQNQSTQSSAMPNQGARNYATQNPGMKFTQQTTPKAANKKKRPINKAFWMSFCGGVAGAVVLLLVVFAISLCTRGYFATGIPGDTISINATSESSSLAEAVAKKCLPSVVSIQVTTNNGSGVGSGVVYDMKGDIITNNHVVSEATEINVTLNEQSYTATLVGSDPSNDIAVLKIDPTGVQLTPIEIANSDDIRVGEWVMSLGSPFGLDQSVSIGIVSSLYRSTIMQGSSGNTIYTNLIQTDAAINPGNSGGALVDENGKLIGINSAIVSTSGQNAGVGFAIPSNTATEIANTLISGKSVEHATLGVSVTTVTAQIAKANNLPVSQGAYIQSVTAAGAAEKAGLKQGDIITKVDNDDITSSDSLILAVRSHKVGDTVRITYYEGSTQKTVDVVLGTDGGEDPQQNQNSTTQQLNPFSNNGNSGGNSNNGSGNGLGNNSGNGSGNNSLNPFSY